MSGYIQLNRSILDWEWWKDATTARVFLYLLLQANWSDSRLNGIEIKRGQHLTSYAKMAEALNITTSQGRTAIQHLKMTGEITVSIAGKGLLVTVENYNKYQDAASENRRVDRRDGRREIAGKSQDDRREIATNNKNNNNNNNNYLEREINKEKEDRAEQDAMLQANHEMWATFKEALMQS